MAFGVAYDTFFSKRGVTTSSVFEM